MIGSQQKEYLFFPFLAAAVAAATSYWVRKDTTPSPFNELLEVNLHRRMHTSDDAMITATAAKGCDRESVQESSSLSSTTLHEFRILVDDDSFLSFRNSTTTANVRTNPDVTLPTSSSNAEISSTSFRHYMLGGAYPSYRYYYYYFDPATAMASAAGISTASPTLFLIQQRFQKYMKRHMICGAYPSYLYYHHVADLDEDEALVVDENTNDFSNDTHDTAKCTNTAIAHNATILATSTRNAQNNKHVDVDDSNERLKKDSLPDTVPLAMNITSAHLEGVRLPCTRRYRHKDDAGDKKASPTLLALNGAGVRDITFMGFHVKVYVASLYTEKPLHSVDEIPLLQSTADGGTCVSDENRNDNTLDHEQQEGQQLDQVLRFDFTFLRSVGQSRVTSAWTQQMDYSVAPECRQYDGYENDRARFIEMFGPLITGGTETVILRPNGDTVMIDQGTIKGTIHGRNFQRVFLSVWFGENAVSDELKYGLLGMRQSSAAGSGKVEYNHMSDYHHHHHHQYHTPKSQRKSTTGSKRHEDKVAPIKV